VLCALWCVFDGGAVRTRSLVDLRSSPELLLSLISPPGRHCPSSRGVARAQWSSGSTPAEGRTLWVGCGSVPANRFRTGCKRVVPHAVASSVSTSTIICPSGVLTLAI
jgi:hypothetical protein